MAKQILITKEKGGVGSTTTASNLGYDLARRGKAVLIVDMDTRGDVAACLGLDPAPMLGRTLRAMGWRITGVTENRETIITTQWPGLDIVRTNKSSTIEAINWAEQQDMDALTDVLAELGHDYDYVIYDTSAASGRLRHAVMRVADLMVVPTHVEALGMPDIAELIEAYGRPLQVIVLPVAYDKRLGLHMYNLGVLQERYGDAVADPIPARVAVPESHSAMAPVLAYAPTNDASEAYRIFTNAVLAGLERPAVAGTVNHG